MQHRKPSRPRNRIDLGDRVQVRVVSRRLRLSEAELNDIVNRIGNSIAAISKEAALRRAKPLRPPAAAVIDASQTDAGAASAPASLPTPT